MGPSRSPGWGLSPSSATGLCHAGGCRELPQLLSKGAEAAEPWLGNGAGHAALPGLARLCGQDTDKGKDAARGPAEAGEFWEGWGSREGGCCRGKAPGLVCAAEHGPDPSLSPWRGAPGVWGSLPVGVCSAAPSAWAPCCGHLHLQEERGNGVGGGRTGGGPGWRSAPSSRHLPRPQQCHQQPWTLAPHTSFPPPC